jgi:hypothetical protein
MLANAFKDLDPRKWFDRMQPQTVSIATILLYINGAFAFLRFLDRTDIEGYMRVYGGIHAVITIGFILCFPLGGFLMANGKLFGWYVSILAAFSPFILRIIFKVTIADLMAWRDVIIGGSYVNLMFEIALCALLLHRMSQEYARRWLS